MKPGLTFFLVFLFSTLFVYQSITIASEDLDLRPVALAAARGAPLSDAEALPRLESAAAGPARADAHLRLGEFLDRRASAAVPPDDAGLARAAVHYRDAARVRPTWGLAQYRLATALRREGSAGEARRHVRNAARCAGNHPALLQFLGDWHLEGWRKAGDPAALLDSLGFYRAAVEREPGRLDAVLTALEPVIPDPRDLARAIPEDRESLVRLALHLEARGKAEAALAVMGTIDHPEGRPYERARARALLRVGRTDEALSAFRSILDSSLDPGAAAAELERDLAPLPPRERARFLAGIPGARAGLARARALRAAGEFAAAMAEVDGALATLRGRMASGPLDREGRAGLLACFDLRRDDWVRRGAPLQAAAEAVEGARLDPTAARWTAAARHFADAGRPKEARDAYERALRLVPPGDEKGRRALVEEIVSRLSRPEGSR